MGHASGELRATVRLATPVVLVQLGIMLQGTVDTMMVGRVSREALAAVALGNTLSFAVLGGLMGCLFALDPLVAQDFGAGRLDGVGLHLVRGLVLATVLSLVAALLFPALGLALPWFRQADEIVPLARSYLLALVPGVLPLLWSVALRQGLQAMSIVRPALVAMAVGNLFNVFANWALVFGRFGFPRLEVTGSALATSASRWVVLLVLVWAARHRLRPVWDVFLARPRAAFDRVAHGGLLRLGAPIALHHSLEMWVFGTVGLLMGTMGALEFAGHQIALMISALSFMVPLGISGAAATRVGNAIGRGDKAGATRSARVALQLGGGVMLLSAALFAWLPVPLSRAFSSEQDVVAMAAVLLPIAAVFQLGDGLQVVAAGVLRGMADTTRPALLALVGFWVLGLPFGWWLAFRADLGPRGLWWGLTAGLAAVALLLLLRVRAMLARPIADLRVAVVEEAEQTAGALEQAARD